WLLFRKPIGQNLAESNHWNIQDSLDPMGPHGFVSFRFDLRERIQCPGAHHKELRCRYRSQPNASIYANILRPNPLDRGVQVWIGFDQHPPVSALVEQIGVAELNGMVSADIQISHVVDLHRFGNKIDDQVLTRLRIRMLGVTPAPDLKKSNHKRPAQSKENTHSDDTSGIRSCSGTTMMPSKGKDQLAQPQKKGCLLQKRKA